MSISNYQTNNKFASNLCTIKYFVLIYGNLTYRNIFITVELNPKITFVLFERTLKIPLKIPASFLRYFCFFYRQITHMT